ncbi:MAG: ATP-binding protein [Planctomycetes bacterium]|nr:ATP-binding protein [Planctomycetota bacterium]
MDLVTPQSLRVACDTIELQRVRRFITEMSRTYAVPVEVENRIILAVDEAVANIIEHGGQAKATDWIDIEIEVEPGSFTVVIRDFSQPFDPRRAPEVDIRSHVQAGKRKGLGIFLLQRIMDRIDYKSTDGGANELRLTKTFASAN